MKPQFFSLKPEKRDRILEACFEEFAAQDYENASLDRLVDMAGISKGGLYEYIESKEDLYLYIVETVFARLYAHLARVALPADILQRFRAVSESAIAFYLEHPRCIAIIVRSGHISDSQLDKRIKDIFEPHFAGLFDSVDEKGLRFSRARLIGHLKWLLVKTRTDFLAELKSGADDATVRKHYMDEWDFLLSILDQGIYW